MSTLEQTSSLTLKDIKLSISESGKGESILCLHGNPGNKSVFSNLMTKLEGLNIKLLAVDRPGHNSTDEIPPEKGNLWNDTPIYASLIDSKLKKKTWILGHGYGCITALKIAIKHPDKVKGLMLINPTIALDKRERVSIIPKFASEPFIGSILGLFLPIDYDDIFNKLIQNAFFPEKPSEEYLDTSIERFKRYENIIAYIIDKNNQIQIQDELKESLKDISVPVFTLFGEKDAFSNMEKQREIISLIPNAKTEDAKDLGHFIPYVNPDACLDFIKKTIITSASK